MNGEPSSARESDPNELRVAVPAEGYHRGLIACQVACPVHTDARGYVRAIAEGRFEDAYLIARGPNPFASICGRICGAPCEIACRRGKLPRVDDAGRYIGNDRPIAIRALKRFACERFGPESRAPGIVLEKLLDHAPDIAADAEEMAALVRAFTRGGFEPVDNVRVAIIGAGPAGLSAAHDLALMGFKPVVFELEPVAAGMLAVGVPDYRLPRELIRREVAVIEALGVEIRTGVRVGADVRFSDLRRDFAAVIIAVGAKRARSLGLPGEGGPRVHGGVDFLRDVSVGQAIDFGSRVVVIGGGNVAYDVARTVVRQSAFDTARTAARLAATASVTLASLETLDEMPADTVEILEGDEEGIARLNGWGPVSIERDDVGCVTGVVFKRCIRVYDEARRFAPLFDEEDRRTVECDTVLIAAGQAPDLSFLKDGGADVEEFRPGWPKVDAATLRTTASGVFAAGDLAHGTRLLIDAVASGKKAARSVYAHVTGRALESECLEMHVPLPRYRREAGYESIARVEMPTLSPQQRLMEPGSVVELGYDDASACREASRCLDCGVTPVFDGTRCVLCGGCVDVCPTSCLKLVPIAALAPSADLDVMFARDLAQEGYRNDPPRNGHSRSNGASSRHDGDAVTAANERDTPAEATAILKDEDRCIRCALCAMRCPSDAIEMERVRFVTQWRAA